MATPPAEEVLDDVAAMSAVDRGEMLRLVASSGGQVRAALTACDEAGLARLAGDLPRALVVCGMGGSGMSGDVVEAVAGPESPVPVLVNRRPSLPRWVGASDAVVLVSCSGTTPETLAAGEAAVRRGCAVVGVGAEGSPLEQLVGTARGVFVPVPQGLPPRASLWSLAVPALLAADALGVAQVPRGVLAETAERLDQVAMTCRPDSDALVNPGKSLALALGGRLPAIWGAGPLAGTAASRFGNQLAENAACPSMVGVLPEAAHNQVVSLDGPFAPADDGDLFRDRVAEPDPVRLAAVLVRSPEDEPELVRLQAEAVEAVAEQRDVPVTRVESHGASRLERLASLLGVLDFGSVYLALLLGTDPTPIRALDEIKARTRGAGSGS